MTLNPSKKNIKRKRSLIGEQANAGLKLGLLIAFLFVSVWTVISTRAQHENNKSEFWQACREGRTELVRKFIQDGVVDSYDPYNGLTTLHVAVKSGNVEIVKMLLEAKLVDVNAQMMWRFNQPAGPTALHLAVEGPKKSVQIVRSLIRHGANVARLNERGMTVVNSLLTGYAHPSDDEILQMLLKAGASPNSPSFPFIDDQYEGRFTPIFQAIDRDEARLLSILLDNGANPNVTMDVEHLSPLLYAIDEVRVQTAKLLFQRRMFKKKGRKM